jgi:hypothetical protein
MFAAYTHANALHRCRLWRLNSHARQLNGNTYAL